MSSRVVGSTANTSTSGDRVLIFGGSGFVGTATCSALSREGLTPIVADIVPPVGDWTFREVDVAVRDAVEVAIVETRPVAVINLAYLLADACEGNLDGAFQINVVGSQNIIEACRRHQVPRLVYASSIAVYGNQADWGNRLITETDRGTPVRLYGWHKLLQDQIAAEYFRQGLSCVGLRMSTIFGPGRKAGLSAAINSLIYPDIGNQTVSLPWSEDEAFDLIHVEDIAESIVALVRIQELEWSLANSGGEYATIGQLISNIRTLRPDICVDLPSQPRTLAHCSRIDWSRLRAILGHDRQRLTQRQIAGAGNAV